MKHHGLSRYKIKRIILYFTEDTTASSASKILRINRNTINAYYNEIREKILQYSLKEQAKELGEFELDESCFETRGVCRKGGGRGAAGDQRLQALTCRVFRHENEFVCGESHANGIGCF